MTNDIYGSMDSYVDFKLQEDFTSRFSILLGLIYMAIPFLWIVATNTFGGVLNIIEPYAFVTLKNGQQGIINGWFFLIGVFIVIIWIISWIGIVSYFWYQGKKFIGQLVNQHKLCLVKVSYHRAKTLTKIPGIYAGLVGFYRHDNKYWNATFNGVDKCFGYVVYNHETGESSLMKPNFIGFIALYGTYKMLDWFEVVDEFFNNIGIFILNSKETKKKRKETLKENTDKSLKVLNNISNSLKKKSEKELEEAQRRMKQVQRNMIGDI